jgi:pimeloyl-ACP methyl ester carboxylesterase
VIDDIFDALGLEEAPVVGHSLGGMLALWYAAGGAERICRLVAIGEPAVALPGVRVRMPLSLLTVRGLGKAVLRSPTPRPLLSTPARARPWSRRGCRRTRFTHRRPPPLRPSRRESENLNSLMHAIDHFRRPRTESVLTAPELAAIAMPTMFIWGADAPYLSTERARPSIEQIPTATLHEVPGGHGPWLVDTERNAELIQTHLTAIAARDR